MSWTRREVVETGLKAGAAAAAGALQAAPAPFFDVHPFVEAHPGAVFIRRTKVARKMDSAAKRDEGLRLAREIFVPSHQAGVPISHRIILKPNVCSRVAKDRPPEELWGTGTDPDFYEGIVMGLKELGLKNFHFLEANSADLWNVRGYVTINQRHGIRMNDTVREVQDFRAGRQITWSKVPDGVVFKRIPYFAPLNEPGTWLLNIAKWKAHPASLSQSVKNEQGLVVKPYVLFCKGWAEVTGVPDFMKPDFHPEAEARLKRAFERHLRMGYARYDSAEGEQAVNQEIWAQKTCDSMSVINTGLAMIEAIYGRDGTGFAIGNDHMANLVMFSKNKFLLDLIGLWLGGHEPGNIHFYRIAKERGFSNTFSPWEVPLYEWVDGRAVPRKLTDFPRTSLVTSYLRKKGEPQFHLVNEPFDYDRVKM